MISKWDHLPVTKKQHIFALLRCPSEENSSCQERSGLLLVFNSEGFLVRQISLQGQLLSWSHTIGGYFAVTMALGQKNVVNLFNSNDLINKEIVGPLRTFRFEDKVRKRFGHIFGSKNCVVTTF